MNPHPSITSQKSPVAETTQMSRSRKNTNVYQTVSQVTIPTNYNSVETERLIIRQFRYPSFSSATEEDFRVIPRRGESRKLFQKLLQSTSQTSKNSTEEETIQNIDGEGENTPVVVTTVVKKGSELGINVLHRYTSQQELNTPEEIEFIERNVRMNDELAGRTRATDGEEEKDYEEDVETLYSDTSDHVLTVYHD